MKNKYFKLLILTGTIAAVILSGCSLSQPTIAPNNEPTANVEPTLNAVKTQVAETIIANMTQSAPTTTPIIIPTNTNVPTDTPVPTNTEVPPTAVPPTAVPTNTIVYWTAVPQHTATPVLYRCSISEVSPKSSTSLTTNQDFDGRWVVVNTGKESWPHGDVDIKFISGTKFQTGGDLFDIKNSVGENGSYTIIIDMKAPASAGTYSTSWAIVRSKITICNLHLTIVVK